MLLMKLKSVLKHYKKIFLIIILCIISFFIYAASYMLEQNYFIRKEHILGMVNPDTFKIKLGNEDVFITSSLIKSAIGNEGCTKAINMAQKGKKIINSLLSDAKVIRFKFTGGKEDGKYQNAHIFIDEKRLGKILYQKHAAIKYTKNQRICET